MTRTTIQWSRSTGGLLPQLPVLNPDCSGWRCHFAAACVTFSPQSATIWRRRRPVSHFCRSTSDVFLRWWSRVRFYHVSSSRPSLPTDCSPNLWSIIPRGNFEVFFITPKQWLKQDKSSRCFWSSPPPHKNPSMVTDAVTSITAVCCNLLFTTSGRSICGCSCCMTR